MLFYDRLSKGDRILHKNKFKASYSKRIPAGKAEESLSYHASGEMKLPAPLLRRESRPPTLRK